MCLISVFMKVRSLRAETIALELLSAIFRTRSRTYRIISKGDLSNQIKRACPEQLDLPGPVSIPCCCHLVASLMSDSETPWMVACQTPLSLGSQARILAWDAISNTRSSRPLESNPCLLRLQH